MRRRKRTEITFETEQVWVIRRSGQPVLAWCPACVRQVRMVRPEEAAVLVDLSPRAIYRRVEDGQLHFTETPEGQLWICLNSLRT